MARTLVDYVKVYATNTGTGPLQLGAAVPGFDGIGALTDAATYGYSIRQGSNWEVGQGVYSLSGGTLTRVVEKSSNGGAPINLGPNAVINFPALAADISRPGPTGPTGPTGPQGPPGSGGADPSLVMYKANNLSDLTDVAAARTNLGLNNTLNFRGSINCSANPNYPAATIGDSYIASVAGKIGGASGAPVDAGDLIVANATNAGGTQAAVGASWFVIEHNLTGALLAANNLSDVANVATARANLGLLGMAIVADAPSDGTTYGRKDGAWAAAGGGGGGGGAMNLLQTVTVSSPVASVALTSFDNALYKHYRIVCENGAPSADWASFFVQVSWDGGATYATSNYSYETNDRGAGAGSGNSCSVSTGQSSWRWAAALRVAASGGSMCADLDLFNPVVGTQYATMMARAFVFAPDNTRYMQENFGQQENAGNMINAAKIVGLSGNIATGTFKLYGFA